MLLRAGMAACLRGPVNSTLGGTVLHVLPLAPSRAQRALAREVGFIGGGFVRPTALRVWPARSSAGCLARPAAPGAPLKLSSLSSSAPCLATAQVRISRGASAALLANQSHTHPVGRGQHAGQSHRRQGRTPVFSFVGQQVAAPCAFGPSGCTRLAVPPNITFNRTRYGSRRKAAPGQAVHRPSAALRRPPTRAG